MTNKEYLQIFKENQLCRSQVVRLLEEQVQHLVRLGNDFEATKRADLAIRCRDLAEVTKWEAISFAEYEKRNELVEV